MIDYLRYFCSHFCLCHLKFHMISKPHYKRISHAQRINSWIKPHYFSQPASCSPSRQSVMVYRRSALSCALKNKMFLLSTRRKGAVWKLSAPLSGLRRRSSSRHTRKRRALSKVSVQRCARRRRRCCRNRSSWRRTLPGQCTNLHYQDLGFTCIFMPP